MLNVGDCRHGSSRHHQRLQTTLTQSIALEALSGPDHSGCLFLSCLSQGPYTGDIHPEWRLNHPDGPDHRPRPIVYLFSIMRDHLRPEHLCAIEALIMVPRPV